MSEAELIERCAEMLWHRFAPDSRLVWSDETHKAEYRDAAKAAFEATSIPIAVLAVLANGEWVAVPKEPTDGMIESGEDEKSERRGMHMEIYTSDIWQIMLAAAPSSPARENLLPQEET